MKTLSESILLNSIASETGGVIDTVANSYGINTNYAVDLESLIRSVDFGRELSDTGYRTSAVKKAKLNIVGNYDYISYSEVYKKNDSQISEPHSIIFQYKSGKNVSHLMVISKMEKSFGFYDLLKVEVL